MLTGAGGTREKKPSNFDSDLPPPPEQPKQGTFSSLRIRNYRLFFSGQVVNNVGTWMNRIAQDWLVFTLTGNNPVALGIAAALQFAPTLFLSLYGGVLADRLDKRKLLIGLQAAMAGCAVILGVLDVSGWVQLWQVYVICFVFGCFTAVETPVRQSFTSEMVGIGLVTNALALNSSSFNLARVVGPAVAGLLIIWVGTGMVFLINAVTTIAVITGLLLMRPSELHRGPAVARAKGQLREALRYVRGRADLVAVLSLVFCVSTFGITFFTTLAIMAANVFHKEADGYGLLSTMLAVGTLSGALLAARRSVRGKPKLRMVFGSALVFGVLEIGAGLMPTYLAFAIALVPVGVVVMTFMNTAITTVQLSVEQEMRGRVMGLYMLLFLGGNPIAGLLTGWLADQFGGRSTFYVGGAVSIIAAVVLGLILRWRASLPERRSAAQGEVRGTVRQEEGTTAQT
ncbi:Predicted arabinose efflux permease, MFS family [Kibdelosporangium aridum]|uniref:Predicted arabinose efflux permease, MFS family n=1 Tax=Kibdelosporangium aridum TaxID=2030 RepID=A0A1W2FYN9_KIBAR|nr:MFS transporter [Kibdelosporangium aridum]SMD26842.1 Predicted arabinose efflux permease, MFS family [Kibdelosporangium aridum]